MCGITGWIDWENDLTQQKPIVAAMAATLAYRGPDAEGMWLSPNAALAHRRLIVVDPKGGTQPMIRKRGNNTYVMTYNGELYNTPELRRELKARGHNFHGHSDTEVLLVSYMEWGPSCVERLNGIYAFAVWNDAEKSLFLARDRMGVKPLFYAQIGGALLYGSELKTLLAHPDVKPEVDAEGLAEIFALGPSRTPGHGVIKGVSEVKPGHCMLYDRNGLKKRKYWTLESHPHEDDLDTTTIKVRSLVLDALERQLVSDVPVCTFLSGGLDSSIITAHAAKYFEEKGTGPLHTFSVDFVGNDVYFKASEFQPNSDAYWVKRVSETFDTHHHYFDIDTEEMVEALTQATIARDLPGMADIDSSLLLFCREMKKHATVALSGECADEVFGGYPWFHDPNSLTSNTFPWIRSIEERTALLSDDLRQQLNPSKYITKRYLETISEVPRLPGEDPVEARRREMFYLNIQWFMQTLLDRKDRMSMATGLEVRVPFCDHNLVEYVWNIPWQMKNYQQREKGILRRAMKGILPEDVLWRRKSPYPKTHNPAYLEAVQEWMLQILNDANSPILPLLDTKAIRKMVEAEGDTFNRPWFGQLMTGPQLFAFLIQVNTWLKEYKITLC